MTAYAATVTTSTGQLLGYARVSTDHQSLDQQTDALTAVGVDPARLYSDKLTGTSTKEQRPGLAALLDYARPGDTIVVAGIDRLDRDCAEVMLTIRDLRDRDIALRPLREGAHLGVRWRLRRHARRHPGGHQPDLRLAQRGPSARGVRHHAQPLSGHRRAGSGDRLRAGRGCGDTDGDAVNP